MRWKVLKFTKPMQWEELGEVEAEIHPTALKLAWAKWPEYAKPEPNYRNGRIKVRAVEPNKI